MVKKLLLVLVVLCLIGCENNKKELEEIYIDHEIKAGIILATEELETENWKLQKEIQELRVINFELRSEYTSLLFQQRTLLMANYQQVMEEASEIIQTKDLQDLEEVRQASEEARQMIEKLRR